MKYHKLLNGCKYGILTAMKIGTDIIQISRITKVVEKRPEAFKAKYLNESEIILAKRVETLAGFWAAKEAISKALGCGIGAHLSFHDIHLSKNTQGAPSFTLSEKAQKIHKITDSSLSISHDGGFAIAVVAINTL